MTEREILDALEDVAKRLEIKIRRESFRGDGGLCKLRGERMIIVNKLRTPAEQVGLLAGSLAQVDLEDMYMAPQVREEIERRMPRASADAAPALEAARLAS